MKKFSVVVEIMLQETFEVKAETREDAVEMAKNAMTDEIEYNINYENLNKDVEYSGGGYTIKRADAVGYYKVDGTFKYYAR